MICPNCGKDGGDAVFCIYCGTRLPSFDSAPAAVPPEEIPSAPMEEPAERFEQPAEPVREYAAPGPVYAPAAAPAYAPAPAPDKEYPRPIRAYSAPAAPSMEYAAPQNTYASPVWNAPAPDGRAVKKAAKWPIIVPILMLLAFLAAFLYRAFDLGYSLSVGYDFGEALKIIGLEWWIISLFPFIGTILFFLHTRRKAFITGIPYMIYVIFALIMLVKATITLVRVIDGEYYYYSTMNKVMLGVTMAIIAVNILLAIIYFLGTLIKIKAPIFGILYLVLAIFGVILLLSSFGYHLYFNFEYYKWVFGNSGEIMSGILAVGMELMYPLVTLFTYTACTIALFSCSKKNKIA